MRKLALALAGVVALAVGTAGNATVTLGTTSLDVSGVTTVGTTTTVGFSDGTLGSTTFAEFLNFSNDVAGLFSIAVATSSPAVNFTSVVLNGPGGTSTALTKTFDNGFSENFNVLSPITLPAGSFTLNIMGTNSGAGSLGGSITMSSAVPEPATWALMLLGFGGMGVALRRRRNPVLAQVA